MILARVKETFTSTTSNVIDGEKVISEHEFVVGREYVVNGRRPEGLFLEGYFVWCKDEPKLEVYHG